MSKVPDAWDDEWSSAADKFPKPTEQDGPKKVTSKVTKAQRRAQQAEFNRQLWAEAEQTKEPNYFLESRSAVPLRTEYKPPPVLLSRKGPRTIQSAKAPTDALNKLDLDRKNESSEDEDELKAREKSLAERQAQAAKDREEKQRRYEERRQELFGGASNHNSSRPNQSGASTPNSLTPPGSRSATPSRGRGRGRGRGGPNAAQHNQHRPQQPQDLYEPSYAAKPESSYLQRRESPLHAQRQNEHKPIRTPRGPDGSGGFGFARQRPAEPQPVGSDAQIVSQT